MILVNTETVPGHRIVELKGLVQGNTIRAKNIGRDIGAGLKNIVGGELTAYTELMTEARREAIQRMTAQAQQLGANAVLNVRFTTSQIAGGAAELYAYGTAVTIAPDGSAPTSAQGYAAQPQQSYGQPQQSYAPQQQTPPPQSGQGGWSQPGPGV